jgi:hypothetical protein
LGAYGYEACPFSAADQSDSFDLDGFERALISLDKLREEEPIGFPEVHEGLVDVQVSLVGRAVVAEQVNEIFASAAPRGQFGMIPCPAQSRNRGKQMIISALDTFGGTYTSRDANGVFRSA